MAVARMPLSSVEHTDSPSLYPEGQVPPDPCPRLGLAGDRESQASVRRFCSPRHPIRCTQERYEDMAMIRAGFAATILLATMLALLFLSTAASVAGPTPTPPSVPALRPTLPTIVRPDPCPGGRMCP